MYQQWNNLLSGKDFEDILSEPVKYRNIINVSNYKKYLVNAINKNSNLHQYTGTYTSRGTLSLDTLV